MSGPFWRELVYEGQVEPGTWRFRDDEGQPLDMHAPPFPPSLDAQFVGQRCSLRMQIVRKRREDN